MITRRNEYPPHMTIRYTRGHLECDSFNTNLRRLIAKADRRARLVARLDQVLRQTDVWERL